MTDPLTQPADSPYHRLLPIGERVDGTPLTEGPLSSIEAVTLRPLAEMRVPEERRVGEVDRAACGHCRPSPDFTIWSDELWQVRTGWEPWGLPFMAGLAPREHVRLEDAPPELLTTLGPLMQRVSEAVKAVPGVARCHFGRFNDGSEHFHLWAFGRPAGMMQGRGPMLMFWDDVLPRVPEEMMREHMRVVAEALAEKGGQAFPGQREVG